MLPDKIYTLFNRLKEPINLVIGVIIVSIVCFLSSLIIKRHNLEETICLALNIYHEGRGEPELGKYAIATVTLNRVASKNYPNSVCRVVYQRSYNQKLKRYFGGFSWTQDNISDTPSEKNAWKDAYDIAKVSYQGEQHSEELSDALFYHADYVQPYWIKNKKPIKTIGNHIFYK